MLVESHECPVGIGDFGPSITPRKGAYGCFENCTLTNDEPGRGAEQPASFSRDEKLETNQSMLGKAAANQSTDFQV